MAADPAMAGRILRAFTAPDCAKALTGPEDTVAMVRPLLLGREVEATVVVALDKRNRPIDATVLTVGSKDYTILEPNGVFRWAMTRARPVSAVVVAHNHPSGDPAPSAQDRDITRRIAQAASVLGLRLLDHIILAGPDLYYSFALAGEDLGTYQGGSPAY